VFELEPELRDDFLRSREAGMRTSRAEPGCHDYVFSADPILPGRVLLYERWEDKASLAAHMTARQALVAADDTPPVPVISSEVLQYEIASVGPVGS